MSYRSNLCRRQLLCYRRRQMHLLRHLRKRLPDGGHLGGVIGYFQNTKGCGCRTLSYFRQAPETRPTSAFFPNFAPQTNRTMNSDTIFRKALDRQALSFDEALWLYE